MSSTAIRRIQDEHNVDLVKIKVAAMIELKKARRRFKRCDLLSQGLELLHYLVWCIGSTLMQNAALRGGISINSSISTCHSRALLADNA